MHGRATELGLSSGRRRSLPITCVNQFATSQRLYLAESGCHTPVFTCEYSRQSATSCLLAGANEAGVVGIFNTARSSDPTTPTSLWPSDCKSDCFQMHHNAIFDLAWLAGEDRIATASGDQTIGLADVVTQKKIGELVGHQGSVKAVCGAAEDPSECPVYRVLCLAWLFADPFRPSLSSTPPLRRRAARLPGVRLPRRLCYDVGRASAEPKRGHRRNHVPRKHLPRVPRERQDDVEREEHIWNGPRGDRRQSNF